jgi:hypothetical protein
MFSKIHLVSTRTSAPSASPRQRCLPTMPQVTPHLRYPGGCSAFFTDLHLDFPRWLRLVALVPLVHASVEGISYKELCFHILGVFPSSNPSNVLVVSAERIRSSVSEMLFKEPFFVVRLFPRIRSAVSHVFESHLSAHFLTMGRYRPRAGFMSLLLILTLLESPLPSASCDA